MASPQGVDYRAELTKLGLNNDNITRALELISKGVSFEDASGLVQMGKPQETVKPAPSTSSKTVPPPSYKELQKRIADLEAQVARKQTISLKVSEKGAVSVYGLGRFPVTLYAEQWGRLGTAMPSIAKFIQDNRAKLSFKE